MIIYFLLFYSLSTTFYIIYLKTWTCRSFIMFTVFLLGAIRQFCYKFYILICVKRKKEGLVVEPFMQEQDRQNIDTI